MSKFVNFLGILAVLVVAGLMVAMPVVLGDGRPLPALVQGLRDRSGLAFEVERGAHWTAPAAVTETARLVGADVDVQLWVFASAREAGGFAAADPDQLVANGRVVMFITRGPPALVDAFRALPAPL